ncbi:MAG: 50S ribosomal protein L23 [Candidatus Spechtbacterales bacterium]
MPILQHIFKKNQGKERPQTQKKKLREEKQGQREQELKKTDKLQTESGSPKTKKSRDKQSTSAINLNNAYGAYGVVLRPHISEKSVSQNSEGKYVFEVAPQAGKKEIQKAIEIMYGVKVDSVNKIKMPAKRTRYRFQSGTSSRPGKAVVTLKKGQEIEVLPQ